MLMLMHKFKGHRSSGVLFIFWVTLVIFASFQLRWEITSYLESDNITTWTEYQFINYITYFTLIGVMLVLNCFADKEPLNTTYPKKSSNPSPEKGSSFLNQIFFHWFFPTVWYGWRRPLTESDIYDINQENTSRELVPPFDKHFAASVEKGRK